MCGIVGFVNFEGHNTEEAQFRINRMADTLIHRGPDDNGYYVDRHAALGHRRLSIIDLVSGQQPMGVKDNSVQIIFNGEIYNFQELRQDLKSMGHRFRTNSDTEVLARGYLEWGEQCVDKLNGMFAFGIWDSYRKILFLARDRVGKKPLYFYHEGPVFAFASEIKALGAGGFKSGGIDLEALDCYFSFGYVPAPRSIYTRIRKLPAAHYLKVSQHSSSQKRYWKLRFSPQSNIQIDEAKEEFEALLAIAVKNRLISEVPLGAFLSGGIDSPLVVSAMADATNSRVITNSIGFDDRQIDELAVSRMVANHLKTDHHEFIVKPDIQDVLSDISWHFDEPFADSSAVPTWYVCKMAKENVTVALSGDGGDESFGGYTFRYTPHMVESKIRDILPPALRWFTFGIVGSFYPASNWLPKPLRLKTFLENLSVGDPEAFYRDLIWLRDDRRIKIYSNEFIKSLHGYTPFEETYKLYTENDAKDPVGRSQYTDIHFYMTDDVLVKVDRMSMAHSLEVRSPLLDYRIIEFAARLPLKLKLKNLKGKFVLRKAAEKRLPEKLFKQPKRGFSIPAAEWLRCELRQQAKSAIFEYKGIIKSVLNGSELEKMWKEHQSGFRDHSVFLWGLMMLSFWERKHFEKNG